MEYFILPGGGVANKTSFDVIAGLWRSQSLSSSNEEKNHTRLGEAARPCNVEMDLEDISPHGCNLGGPSHVHFDPGTTLELVEPIPSCKPPLHSQHGCEYFNDDIRDGWAQKEVDAQGNTHPHCQAHYLTHSRKASVSTRCCSMGHEECKVFYTGRSDGFHRDTTDTMIRR